MVEYIAVRSANQWGVVEVQVDMRCLLSSPCRHYVSVLAGDTTPPRRLADGKGVSARDVLHLLRVLGADEHAGHGHFARHDVGTGAVVLLNAAAAPQQ